MREALPGVTHWYVGGHSLGGSMACVYASKHADALKGVVLWGTYCGVDISHKPLRVLMIGGERDGIFPPTKLEAKRDELPLIASVVQIKGLNHAQFGNYGKQPGDNVSTIDDEQARNAIVHATTAFLSER